MPSTYSDLKIELIATGEESGTWGNTTNTNLGTALEEAIVGRATANFTTDADLTISLTDTNATQVARNYILNVTSGVSLSTTRNLIVPTIDKPYIIENNTTGGQSIVVKTSAGTGVTVPNGKSMMVYANSTNVVPAFTDIPSTTTAGGNTLVNTGTAQTFTAAQTFRAASAIRSEAATTQDAIVIAGRAGGTSSYAVTLTPATLASSTTLTLPNVTDTVATIGTAQTFTAAQTFRAASALRSEAASTQDAVVIAGRAGGTSSYAITITPSTLSASRTATLPDGGGNYTLGYQNVPAVGTKTSSYQLATTDVGKYVQVGTGGSITIPDGVFSEGDAINIFNNTSGSITITCSITTAYIAGTDADKATVSLATRGLATILFISSTVCVITGNVS